MILSKYLELVAGNELVTISHDTPSGSPVYYMDKPAKEIIQDNPYFGRNFIASSFSYAENEDGVKKHDIKVTPIDNTGLTIGNLIPRLDASDSTLCVVVLDSDDRYLVKGKVKDYDVIDKLIDIRQTPIHRISFNRYQSSFELILYTSLDGEVVDKLIK